MTPEQWQQVNELFQAALEREPDERARFVAEACEGDELLRSEVESLVAFHDKRGSFMEKPAVATVAANLMSDEQDQLEAGQTLGHYQILDSLGAGGMGEVYLARDTKLGRKIALKLLPTYLSKDRDRLRRFEQEARVASTISHPNIAQSNRAIDIDPLSLRTNANLAWDLFFARRYDEAIGQSLKVIDMEPKFWLAHMYLGLAYEQKGKFPEAAAELEKARQLSDSPLVLGMLGGVYAVSGRRAEAMKVLEELRDQAKQRFVCPYETATVYVGLGETDEAFKWLERGYQDRSRCMVWLKVDPRFDSVRSDSRFTDLERRVGLLQ